MSERKSEGRKLGKKVRRRETETQEERRKSDEQGERGSREDIFRSIKMRGVMS